MSAGSCPLCGQPAPTGAALCGYCLLVAGAEYEYRTVTVLGRGEHGTVYLAEQVPGNRLVAVKVFNGGLDLDALMQRVEACREALSRLGHHGMARTIDVGVTDAERAYVVSEFVRGLPIDRYCRRSMLDDATRTRLVRSIGELIHAAHAAGIIHGGIKPTNVLVVPTAGVPLVRVLDFGLRAGSAAQDLAALAVLTESLSA